MAVRRPAAKRMLERAAVLPNTMMPAFVVSHALEAADHPIRERGRFAIVDWNLFIDVLVEPPEPNAVLRRAFAAHGRLISKTASA